MFVLDEEYAVGIKALNQWTATVPRCVWPPVWPGGFGCFLPACSSVKLSLYYLFALWMTASFWFHHKLTCCWSTLEKLLPFFNLNHPSKDIYCCCANAHSGVKIWTLELYVSCLSDENLRELHRCFSAEMYVGSLVSVNLNLPIGTVGDIRNLFGEPPSTLMLKDNALGKVKDRWPFKTVLQYFFWLFIEMWAFSLVPSQAAAATPSLADACVPF